MEERVSATVNINELERMTGITKQNIRFYEKKGLLHPGRNLTNNYREYTQEDVKTLQIIKILRKLDMPIDDIRQILSEETQVGLAMQKHLEELTKKKSELESCISICKSLCRAELKTLDVDGVLSKMNDLERKGGVFMSITADYKQVKQEEAMRKFTFRPDTMIMNPREFTDALLAYADENDLRIFITKEGMYPVFTIDNVEYTAERVIGRFGAVVHCEMTHPETIEDKSIPEGKRTAYKFIMGNMLGIVLILYIIISGALIGRSIGLSLLMAVCLLPLFVWTFRVR